MLDLLEKYGINKNLYKIIKYNKNDIIFNEGEIATNICFVEKGIITIKASTINYNDFEITKINPNGFFGSYLVFNDNNKYLGNVISQTNSIVIFFTKNNFLKALENKDFLEYYLKVSANQTITIQNKLKVLSQHYIEEKILFLLHNNYIKNNTYSLKIKSKQALADFINCPRPSLSRSLIILKNKGIITYDRHQIILKKEATM